MSHALRVVWFASRNASFALSCAIATVQLALPSACAAHAHAAPPSGEFRASEELVLADLLRAVSRGGPEIAAAQRTALVAEADARAARLLGNPTLDAAWSSIPVGETNPPELRRPLASVPSYGVGIAYTIPVGKRQPRIRGAEASARAAHAELQARTREQALQLAQVLGELATLSLRRDGIAQLLAGGERAAELAEARLRAQFGTPLDVDQMRIEVERTAQLLASVDSDVELALAACAGLIGVPCVSFVDAAAARAYLARWLRSEAEARALTERPDLRALAAHVEAASSEAERARAERLPDPTVRLGYVHDRFVISGNQLNSLNLGVSVPLPLFDRGTFRARAALAAREQLADERARRLAVAGARLPALARRLALSRSRCAQLDAELVPRARAVLGSLEQAVENRLLPLTQVIQSRRIVSELLIEQAESCGDAYGAALELLREQPTRGER